MSILRAKSAHLVGHLPLMRCQIHLRPVTKEESSGIEGHAVDPGLEDGRLRLVIEREPADITDSELFSLVVELNALIT